MTSSLLAFIRDAYRVFAWRLPALFTLTLVNAVLEGFTLAMLLPLFASLGFGGAAAAPDNVTRAVAQLFGALSMPVSTFSIAVAMAILIFTSAVFFLLEAYLASRLQAAYVAHWQNRLFAAVVAASWDFLRRRRPGDIVGGMSTEAARLGNAFYQADIIVSSLVFLIAQAAIAAVIAPAVVAAMGALTLLLFGLTRHLMRRALTHGNELTRANADLLSASAELLGAIKLVKGTSRENETKRVVSRIVDRIELYSFRNLLDVQIVRAVFNYGSGAALVALLIVGPLLFGVQIAAIVIVVAMFVRLFPKVTALRQCMQAFGFSFSGYETLRRIAAEADAAREGSTGVPPQAGGAAAIDFRKTTMRADAGVVILDAIDLDIAAGSFVAVVGPTSAGKTTLVDCVLGLVAPTSGDVLIDGVSIRTIALPVWRRLVGYLGQDPVLFAGSIRENIIWGRTDFTDADIAAALRAANAEFVFALPRGLDTVIQEGANTFSGGERQRLALARALIGEPRLLILDEVTSALDVETERRIAEAVSSRRGLTTVLAVTHRLAAVSNADLIVMMEAGRVVERGSLTQLLAVQGRFAAFWRMQSEDNSGATADRLVTA
ncbi:MAG TPA: ABC transporter ATP-binding protein [Xanthobacteraceae bacterium]|nr:ABC transporter ATP-binding protein [Xanthobacteraceae bacterium]